MSDLYVLMEEYLEGTLTGDALKEFETKLASDTDLQEELKLLEALKGQMKAHGKQKTEENALRETLGNIGGQYFKEEQSAEKKVLTTKVVPIWRRGVIQLIAALVVLAITIILFNSGNQDFDMNDFYEPAVGLRQTISEEEILSKGLSQYKLENYSKAIEELSKIETNDNRYVVAQYYIGHSYFSLKKYEKAIAGFDVVLRNQDSFFRPAEEVKWSKFLALVGLKETKSDRFRALYMELRNSSYSDQLEKLFPWEF